MATSTSVFYFTDIAYKPLVREPTLHTFLVLETAGPIFEIFDLG